MDKYVKSKIAVKELKVGEDTLRRWSKQGKIDFILTPGRQRLYNIEKFLIEYGVKEEIPKENELNIKKKICYCRVSTKGQKDDLERQINLMTSLYPNYEFITDIGSGLNYKRKGLLQIIDYAIKNELEELVIAYKDRLSRFSYDLLEYIITKYSNGKITIINNTITSPEEEIVTDLVTIINVFSAKINGSRKYKKEITKANIS
jgi:predicted site-specific integrase-resolvase